MNNVSIALGSGSRPPPKAGADARAEQGKLKIYLGMAAGVGKTYSMLQDAIALRRRGVDVLAGFIQPHGRRDTEQLAAQLECLAPKQLTVTGSSLAEFDLDAALKRKPALILVDELAHSNAAGARHTKRWQDIEDLLHAGISVYATLNVQHVESLNDVVAQITGITVQETVPDSFFARADEIELIDIPPAELIERLKEGKVYPLDRVPAALANFFKEGNLLALRELVLRHSAQQVDAQIQRFRRRNAVGAIWPSGHRVLVLVGPTPMAKPLVRYAHRLASQLDGQLYALTFEGTHFAERDKADQALAYAALELAEDLGAVPIVRQSQNIMHDILEVARELNLTDLVVGKSLHRRWRNALRGGIVHELIESTQGLSLHVINAQPSETAVPQKGRSRGLCGVLPSLVTLLVVAVCTGICALLPSSFDLANLIMVYLVGVTWVATRYGMGEAALSAVLSVAAFDFFFVPPRFSFAVADLQYTLTFVIMLGVSLVLSRLASRLKAQAESASERERRTSSLHALARELLMSQTCDAVKSAARTHIARAFPGAVRLLLASELKGSLGAAILSDRDLSVARWVSERNEAAGLGTATLPGSSALFLPVGTQESCRAVLQFTPEGNSVGYLQRQLMESFCTQLAATLERLSFEAEARAAQAGTEREMLKNVLLTSISHDLRTPLTVISGTAAALRDRLAIDDVVSRDLVTSVQTETDRLARMVRNVLDLTRFELDRPRLVLDWYTLEELIGAATSATRSVLKVRKVHVQLPNELPLIRVDGVLMQQVLVNIFENIAKYTPESSSIFVSASCVEQKLILIVADNGPGFPLGSEEKVFQKLYTAHAREGGGIGLGLTICKVIVEAHEGSIKASNRPEGGAQITIMIPQKERPPCVEL